MISTLPVALFAGVLREDLQLLLVGFSQQGSKLELLSNLGTPARAPIINAEAVRPEAGGGPLHAS